MTSQLPEIIFESSGFLGQSNVYDVVCDIVCDVCCGVGDGEGCEKVK